MATLPSTTGHFDLVNRLNSGALPASALTAQDVAKVQSGYLSGDSYPNIAAAIADAVVKSRPVLVSHDTVIRIPTDCVTLQRAFDTIVPLQNTKITLQIQTGHRLSTGFLLYRGDWQRFEVTSVDPLVYLDAAWVAGTPVMWLENGLGPLWSILVDCEGKDVAYGEAPAAFNVIDNSKINISPGCGVRNGGGRASGLFVYHRSVVLAKGAVFTGFAANNYWVTHVSDAWLEEAVGTGAGENGIFVSRVSRVYASGANFSNAVAAGVLARRSLVCFFSAGSSTPKANTCGTYGIEAHQGSFVISDLRNNLPLSIAGGLHAILADTGALVVANSAVISGMTGDGLRVSSGGKIVAQLASLTGIGAVGINLGPASSGRGEVEARGITVNSVGNCVRAAEGGTCEVIGSILTSTGGTAIYASSGACVVASSSTVSAAVNALHAEDGASIVAPGVIAPGSGNVGAYAYQGGEIIAPNANFSAAGVNGIQASRGAKVVAHATNARRGASDATTDVVCASGSTVQFNSGTGGTSVTVNAVSASGIIFK